MPAKRLVLFVEGKGDKSAVPILARRIIASAGANDALFVDPEPFVVRGIGTLVKDAHFNWHRWLNAVGKTRKNTGAVLLVLDGDADRVPQTWEHYAKRYGSVEFCAYRAAATLAHEARSSRAGDAFSLSAVFVMKEFEAWLVAGVESLRGISLADERGIVPDSATVPNIDIEAKRDARGVLCGLVPGYDQSLDQAVLASHVDMEFVAQRCRSFRRFQSAITQLAHAVRTGNAIVSPSV